jgi:hypothetical protein
MTARKQRNFAFQAAGFCTFSRNRRGWLKRSAAFNGDLSLHEKLAWLDVRSMATKDLTTWTGLALRRSPRSILSHSNRMIVAALLGSVAWSAVGAQESKTSEATPRARRAAQSVQTATIHWQDVPLRDAIGRLERLFGQPIFLDRRIDPGTRVTLEATASSAMDVLMRVAAEHGWQVIHLGDVVYAGPAGAGSQLDAAITALKAEVAELLRSENSSESVR